MRPTLRQLQYVVAIAETGRFGEAARLLNVSQPSLSAQIAEVEAQLGAILIERGRTGAHLTAKGEVFVERARAVLRQMEDLKAAMQDAPGTLSGRIRLGVLPTIGPYLLPPLVKRLHTMFPDLKLGVRDERTVDLETRLSDGRLDTIISTTDDHHGTVHEFLFREHMYICVSSDDALAGGDTVPLAALAGRTLMSLGQGHRLSVIVQKLADVAGARMSTEYEGTSLDALRQMAAMGTGIAVLPSLYALCEARRDTALALRRIDHPLACRDISLIWRDTSPLGDAFGLLARVLRDVGDDLLAVETSPAAA